MRLQPIHPPVPPWDGHCEDALFNERGTAFAQPQKPWVLFWGSIGWAALIGALVAKVFF